MARRARGGDPEDAVRRRKQAVLPDDSTVTLSAARAAAGIDQVFENLERELIGLVPVKDRVREIGSLLLVDQVRQQFGLLAPRPNLHMCFTGAPGTGKTTVALRMAEMLHRLGYLSGGQLVHARDEPANLPGRQTSISLCGPQK